MFKDEHFPTYSGQEAELNKYHDFYKFSPISLVVLDSEARIFAGNLAFTQTFGIELSQLEGTHFYDFVHLSDRNTYQVFLQVLLVTKTVKSCEIQLTLNGNHHILTQVNGLAVNRGEKDFYYIVISNIGEKKELELQKYERAIEQQRIQVLANFIRDTSHDLRTPLTKMATGLYLLEHTDDLDLRHKRVSEISRELFLLVQLIEQLQKMAVLDSLVELEFQPTAITNILDDVIMTVKPSGDAKKINILRNFQANLPEIPIDTDRIFLAFLNLMNNAIQFTPQNGLISLIVYQQKHYIIIDVVDHGIGITPDIIPRIFERFFKADVARSIATGGAGLGLSIVQRIVELHHGQLEVSSLPNIKTVFQISLPLSHPSTIMDKNHPKG